MVDDVYFQHNPRKALNKKVTGKLEMTGVDEAVNSLKQVVLELEQKMQSRTVRRVEQLQQIDELKLSRQHELEEALLSVTNSLDSIISKLIDLAED